MHLNTQIYNYKLQYLNSNKLKKLHVETMNTQKKKLMHLLQTKIKRHKVNTELEPRCFIYKLFSHLIDIIKYLNDSNVPYNSLC